VTRKIVWQLGQQVFTAYSLDAGQADPAVARIGNRQPQEGRVGGDQFFGLFDRIPDSARLPPGRTWALIAGARTLSGLARMLATTRSNCPLNWHAESWKRALTRLLSALLRADVTACGSISTPTTSVAPSLAAAMARIPEPQP
jgi:hypothetical protein